MPRAGIVVDDWKLPVFRKRLTAEGYRYVDGGRTGPGTTLLTVDTNDIAGLTAVVAECQAECGRNKKS